MKVYDLRRGDRFRIIATYHYSWTEERIIQEKSNNEIWTALKRPLAMMLGPGPGYASGIIASWYDNGGTFLCDSTDIELVPELIQLSIF